MTMALFLEVFSVIPLNEARDPSLTSSCSPPCGGYSAGDYAWGLTTGLRRASQADPPGERGRGVCEAPTPVVNHHLSGGANRSRVAGRQRGREDQAREEHRRRILSEDVFGERSGAALVGRVVALVPRRPRCEDRVLEVLAGAVRTHEHRPRGRRERWRVRLWAEVELRFIRGAWCRTRLDGHQAHEHVRHHALNRWLEAADELGVALLVEPAVQRQGRVAGHLDDPSEPIERDAGLHDEPRSEERRVGKEGRCRWWAD